MFSLKLQVWSPQLRLHSHSAKCKKEPALALVDPTAHCCALPTRAIITLPQKSDHAKDNIFSLKLRVRSQQPLDIAWHRLPVKLRSMIKEQLRCSTWRGTGLEFFCSATDSYWPFIKISFMCFSLPMNFIAILKLIKESTSKLALSALQSYWLQKAAALSVSHFSVSRTRRGASWSCILVMASLSASVSIYLRHCSVFATV